WVLKKAYDLVKKAGGFIKDKFTGKGKKAPDTAQGKPKEDANGKGKAGEFDGKVGKNLSFSAKGESHRLWVQVSGQKAKVMVASTPSPVLGFLSQPSVVALEKKPEAKSAIASARALAGKVDMDAGQVLQSMRGEKNQEATTKDAEVSEEQQQLVEKLRWI